MATKVGGFTKSGVVQCVKLVEEVPSPSVDGFNGVVEGGHIKFNNGYVMTLRETFDSPQEINIPYDKIQSFTFSDTYNVDVFTLTFNGVNVTASLLSTGEEIWNNGQSTYLNYLKITPIGDLSEYTLYIFELFFDSTVGRYQIPERITATTITCNYNGTPPLLPAAAKLSSITVRMGKDGTLKCKELIEEEVVDNIDSFAPLQTSSSSSHTFILKNGTYIDLYENDTLINVTTQGGIECFQSGIPVLLISFYPNQTGYTSSNSQTAWDYNGPVSIVRVNVLFSDPTNYTNVNKCVITSNNKTATFTGRVSTDGIFLGNLSDTSDSWDLLYNQRFKIPTVRIYKDGTIRCAEVEEATVTQIPWTQSLTKTPGLLQYTFNNGYVLSVKNENTGDIMEYADDASGFLMQFLYEVTTPSTSTTSMAQFVTYSGSKAFTTYDAFYDTSKNINYIYFSAAPSYSSYVELVDDSGNIVGKLSGSGSYRVNQSDDKAIQIPIFDLVSYSWPGSTIVKATNTFITSDNKNFLTNTGDQFMVR